MGSRHTCLDPAKEGFWLRFITAKELPKRLPRMIAAKGLRAMDDRSR
jgi:hypothetical protein